jgi:hypothetical protein
MEKFENLKALVASIEEDVKKFNEKSNKSAGTRVRQVLQQIKSVSQELRKEISEKKNG